MTAEREIARIEAEKAAAEKARLEKELKDKANAEAKAIQDAQIKAAAERKAKEDEERKAANAPDKEKLLSLAMTISEIKLPELSGDEPNVILCNVLILLRKVINFIIEKADKL